MGALFVNLILFQPLLSDIRFHPDRSSKVKILDCQACLQLLTINRSHSMCPRSSTSVRTLSSLDWSIILTSLTIGGITTLIGLTIKDYRKLSEGILDFPEY